MVSVGIVGASGYSGVELLRILSAHPDVRLSVATSRQQAGSPVSETFPGLRGVVDLDFVAPELDALASCDVVFFATPNGTAMEMAPALLEAGTRVIDIGADFRLRDPAVWERWYGMTHACPELLDEAVYGLPELFRSRLREARLVGNPGCYPTCVLLGFAPLLEHGLVDPARLVANAVSGLTGAGRGAKVANLFAEVTESFTAYGVGGHRHNAEIDQALRGLTDGPVGLIFVPHRVPMSRGMHATLYAILRADAGRDVQALYEERYAGEPFVDVLPAGSHPETRTVRGSNLCRLGVHRPAGGDTVVVLSVIDNLTKGAAGQAVQNMNIMFGLGETAGLGRTPMVP